MPSLPPALPWLSVLLCCTWACSAADDGQRQDGPAPAAGGGQAGAGGASEQPVGGAAGEPVGGGGVAPSIYEGARSNDAPVSFVWAELDPNAGSCKPGFYMGSFDGLYGSGLTFVGVPIPVAGDVNMFLEPSANGEFLSIKNGAVCGFANLTIPFYGELAGELDCTTGQLFATMKGGYISGVPVQFEGFITSGYNFLTQALDTGTWCLKEAGVAGPNDCVNGGWPLPYGGSGYWNATWVSDTPGVPCERPVGL